MVSCSVPECDVTRRNNPRQYTFHRFPCNPALREKWKRTINRPDWTPSANSTICSKHFDCKCFLQRKHRRILIKDSIPTLFVPIQLPRRRQVSSYVNRDIALSPEVVTPSPHAETTPGHSNLALSPRKKKIIDHLSSSSKTNTEKPQTMAGVEENDQATCISPSTSLDEFPCEYPEPTIKTEQDPIGDDTNASFDRHEDGAMPTDVLEVSDRYDGDINFDIKDEPDVEELEPECDDEDDGGNEMDIDTVKLEVEEHTVDDALKKQLQRFIPCTRQMLPRVNMFAIIHYLIQLTDIYNKLNYYKLQEDYDDVYGDDVIGSVAINKIQDDITIQSTVAFTRDSAYKCTLNYNIATKSIKDTNCECHQLACEHIIAFLMWLHRRAEERIDNDMSFNLEPVTRQTEFLRAKDFAMDDDTDSASETVDLPDNIEIKPTDIIKEFMMKCEEANQCDSLLYKHFRNDEVSELSIDRLLSDFRKKETPCVAKANSFIRYCKRMIDKRKSARALGYIANRADLDSEVRQYVQCARIDAEHLLAAADGDVRIVDDIMYPELYKEDKTVEAMREILETKMSLKIKRCGLYISKECPILCASPYGVTDTHVVDIIYVKNVRNLDKYIINGILKKHVKAKLQIHMYMTDKNNSTLYLGYKNDDDKKQIQIHHYPFNYKYCRSLIDKATVFWEKHVLSKLLNR